MSGYHNKEIPRGEYGELSKITEEYNELMDAADQDNSILIMCELADLVGAIEGYAELIHGITLTDIIRMKEATSRAFDDGTRIKKTNKSLDNIVLPVNSSSAWTNAGNIITQNLNTTPQISDPVFDDVLYVPKDISSTTTLNLIALFFYVLALVISGILVLNGDNAAYILFGLIIGSCVLGLWIHYSDKFHKVFKMLPKI